jgi:hypothetical protein
MTTPMIEGMTPEKKARLEARGWKFGDADELLGTPTIEGMTPEMLTEAIDNLEADFSAFGIGQRLSVVRHCVDEWRTNRAALASALEQLERMAQALDICWGLSHIGPRLSADAMMILLLPPAPEVK